MHTATTPGGCLHVEQAPNTVRGSTGTAAKAGIPRAWVPPIIAQQLSQPETANPTPGAFFFCHVAIQARPGPRKQGEGREERQRNQDQDEKGYGTTQRARRKQHQQAARRSRTRTQQHAVRIPGPVFGSVCWPRVPSPRPASGAAPFRHGSSCSCSCSCSYDCVLASVLTNNPTG